MEAVCKNRSRQWGLVWDASVDEAVLKGERSRTSLQITKKAMSSTRRRITPKGQLWWKEKHFSASAAADEKAHHLKEARRENFQRKRIEDLTRIKKDYLLPIPSWERAAWRQMFLLVGFKLQTHYKRAPSEDLYFYVLPIVQNWKSLPRKIWDQPLDMRLKPFFDYQSSSYTAAADER